MALHIDEDTTRRASALGARGVRPTLALISFGRDPGAEAYAGRLRAAGARCGIDVRPAAGPAHADRGTVLALVEEITGAPEIHGALVLSPLPGGLAPSEAAERIPPAKDVEGLHPHNAGRLAIGRAGPVPTTAAAVMALLEHHGVAVAGAHAVVVGRSEVFGRPLAALLLAADATVTVAHSRTSDLAKLTRQADLVAIGVGRAGLLTADMIRPGATVVDAGINVTPAGIVGDADGSIAAVAGAWSPVPGGLGAVTTALLLRNVVAAAEDAVERRGP